MEFSRSEVKIVDASTKYVNRWKWYKYLLVATILVLIWFCYFLITTECYGVFLVIVGPAIGFILGYLSRNWETQKKEALLLKLVTNQKHLTNRLTKTPANNAGTDSQNTLAR
jgi:hypothetical protein